MDKLRRVWTALSRGLDRVTPARLSLAALVVLLIVLHGLAPDAFVVDSMSIALLAVLLILILAPMLKSATLPGGAGFNFRDELSQLDAETQAAQQEAGSSAAPPVAPPPVPKANGPNETTATSATAGPGPEDAESSTEDLVDEILEEASRAPRVALILLSAHLERAVRELLLTTGWGTGPWRGLRTGVERLVEVGVMTAGAASALNSFARVRNGIVHGFAGATDDEVIAAIDSGIALLRVVRAIPRERHFVQHVGVPVFADENMSKELDVKAVILKAVSPGAAAVTFRIFPTSRMHFEIGMEVAWEWSGPTHGEAWYADPEDGGHIKQAWLGSMEFVGRNIDDL